jgi:predicted SprT family Zn-dependent metalloprotease
MQFFGFTPDRCHNYDMTGVKVKRQKLFDYTCACPGRTHKLTTVRHNRVQNGYYKDLRCTRCNRQVAFAGNQNQLAMAA